MEFENTIPITEKNGFRESSADVLQELIWTINAFGYLGDVPLEAEYKFRTINIPTLQCHTIVNFYAKNSELATILPITIHWLPCTHNIRVIMDVEVFPSNMQGDVIKTIIKVLFP